MALTAMSHGLDLVTRDPRAARTYEAIGADHQFLGVNASADVGLRVDVTDIGAVLDIFEEA